MSVTPHTNPEYEGIDNNAAEEGFRDPETYYPAKRHLKLAIVEFHRYLECLKNYEVKQGFTVEVFRLTRSSSRL